MTPVYFHAVTAHLLVLGLGIGAAALGLACWLQSREARLVALAVIGGCAVAAGPIYWAGKQAYREVRGAVDEQGQAWLDLHLERGDRVIWGYAALALFSGAAILANRRRWRSEGRWVVAAGGATLVILAAGAWTAQAGGRVRHLEFRPAEPLVIEEEEPYEVE